MLLLRTNQGVMANCLLNLVVNKSQRQSTEICDSNFSGYRTTILSLLQSEQKQSNDIY